MPNRRHVLQSGLALSATAALAPSPVAAETSPPVTFTRFVFDNRFAESILLARRAAERGTVLWETSGDMTALWCDHLKAAWDAAPVALAGVTTQGGLFVLETLAADYRMRVVYRGEVPGHLSAAHAQFDSRADAEGTRTVPLYSWIIAAPKRTDQASAKLFGSPRLESFTT